MSPETCLNLKGKSENVFNIILSELFPIRNAINICNYKTCLTRRHICFSVYLAAKLLLNAKKTTLLTCRWPVSNQIHLFQTLPSIPHDMIVRLPEEHTGFS